MRMSKSYMLVQVTMWFAKGVTWMVSVLVMHITHMDMGMDEALMNMEMGMSLGHEKQNASCHGT